MRNRDRAALLTVGVIRIIATSSIPDTAQREAVENLLRDEIADIRREIAADRHDNDSA